MNPLQHLDAACGMTAFLLLPVSIMILLLYGMEKGKPYVPAVYMAIIGWLAAMGACLFQTP